MAKAPIKCIPAKQNRTTNHSLLACPETQRDQKWIDEALASGPAQSLTEKEMDAIRDRVLRRKAV